MMKILFRSIREYQETVTAGAHPGRAGSSDGGRHSAFDGEFD